MYHSHTILDKNHPCPSFSGLLCLHTITNVIYLVKQNAMTNEKKKKKYNVNMNTVRITMSANITFEGYLI